MMFLLLCTSQKVLEDPFHYLEVELTTFFSVNPLPQLPFFFNVVDDTRLTRSELAEWIAKRWHIPIVEDGPAPPVPDRRISNRKLKAVLEYSFRHPTLHSFLSEHPDLPPFQEKRN